MNVYPVVSINGRRWIDCPEPVSYAAADHASAQGHKPGTPDWWKAYKQFKRNWYEGQLT